ncbi:hypothetical protein [Streptomyces zaehneri]|uniref:hypothetical protein n=1 Tax=Streptomyces zaehneri TaxID=3051180 RepID=UPI0028D70E05|nr:hypothetical protein [Streptomyces sp. DSM 40713]
MRPSAVTVRPVVQQAAGQDSSARTKLSTRHAVDAQERTFASAPFATRHTVQLPGWSPPYGSPNGLVRTGTSASVSTAKALGMRPRLLAAEMRSAKE